MTTDTIRIEVFIKTNKIGSECSDVVELGREEWESMTDQERDQALMETAWNMAEWGYSVQEPQA